MLGQFICARLDEVTNIGVGEEVAAFAEGDTVSEWFFSEVAVHESCVGADCFNAKPQHQVFRTVSTIESNDLASLYTIFLNEPISHTTDQIVELYVGVRSVLEDEEDIVCRLGVLGPVLEVMVYQRLSSSKAFFGELLRGRGDGYQRSMSNIVSDEELGISIHGPDCCQRHASSCPRHCGFWSALPSWGLHGN